MHDERSAQIARLEQLLDELGQESAHLKDDVAHLHDDLDGLRVAIRHVVSEAFGVFDAIDRQTEAGKMRLEKTLGRQFTRSTLIDELAKREVTS